MKVNTNLDRTKLENTYYGMRHGFSRAQELGIIISDPKSGKLKKYGLTELGIGQALASAEKCQNLVPGTPIIVSSDFSRAMETAAFARIRFGATQPYIAWQLRERYFGIYEGTSNANYQKVWDGDKRDPDYHRHGGESVNDVLDRLFLLILLIEDRFSGGNIVLVSHGDPLKILECWFRGINPRLHRSMRQLKNAEIRRLSA